MWVTKLLISQVKKKDFLPQNDQIWPKIGIFGQLCALLVSRLVVVARRLYLARHLFTLYYVIHGRPLIHLSCRSVPPHPLNDKYKDPSLDILHLLFCSSLSQSPNQYKDHPRNIKRQVCILFVGAARFLYWTLGRCRSARSMHAPEKSDILKQVDNPCCHYFDPYYHFVRQKDCLLTHTPHTFDMDS